MGKRIDLAGQRFGRLVVLEYSHRQIINAEGHGRDYWKCRCDCGKTTEVAQCNLKSKRWKGKSCGCYRNEQTTKRNKENPPGICLPPGDAVFNYQFAYYKRAAKYRGYCFQLSKKEFRETTKQNCKYCGVEPSPCSIKRITRSPYMGNGIDRVDNSKGYVEGNVVACCKMCNQMKMAYSQVEFIEQVKKIYKHSKLHN